MPHNRPYFSFAELNIYIQHSFNRIGQKNSFPDSYDKCEPDLRLMVVIDTLQLTAVQVIMVKIHKISDVFWGLLHLKVA